MLSSLKTTLAGVATAFLNLYANGVNAKSAAVSIGIALLGAVAKDFNTTGSGQPK